MTEWELKHFTPGEFREWVDDMHPELLRKLDEFRERLRAPVMISPAIGALGRHQGQESLSRHNIDHWAVVQAADVMLPRGPDLRDEEQGRKVVDLAREVGFGGIGVYLDWKPYPGLHLDVRPLKADGTPALWTRIGGQYTAIDKAWETDGKEEQA